MIQLQAMPVISGCCPPRWYGGTGITVCLSVFVAEMMQRNVLSAAKQLEADRLLGCVSSWLNSVVVQRISCVPVRDCYKGRTVLLLPDSETTTQLQVDTSLDRFKNYHITQVLSPCVLVAVQVVLYDRVAAAVFKLATITMSCTFSNILP